MKNLLRDTCWVIVLCVAAPAARALEVILPPDINHTKLHEAAEYGDVVKAREALKALSRSEKREGINLLDREGYTPLCYAARAGCLEVVKLLVKEGASVDRAEEHGWTPLLRAADQRHAEVVRYLLEHGANPNFTTRLGKTPLSVALAGSVFSYGPKGDRDATVGALLEKRADASPLLGSYDQMLGVAHERGQQIEALQAERLRLTEIVRKFQEERLRLENEYHRLEIECQRLKEIIEKVRSTTGDPGYRPG